MSQALISSKLLLSHKLDRYMVTTRQLVKVFGQAIKMLRLIKMLIIKTNLEILISIILRIIVLFTSMNMISMIQRNTFLMNLRIVLEQHHLIQQMRTVYIERIILFRVCLLLFNVFMNYHLLLICILITGKSHGVKLKCR